MKDDCANAVILRHSSALFSWGSCASRSLVSQPTVRAMLCSSFDGEIGYFSRPCGQSLLTFDTSVPYSSSWRMTWKRFVLLFLSTPLLPSLFLLSSLSVKDFVCLLIDYITWKGPVHNLLFPAMWLTNLIRSRTYHSLQSLCWA